MLRAVLPTLLILAILMAGLWWGWLRPRLPDSAVVDAAYARPLPPPVGAMTVFHLGHSLVGQDMPAMLQQLSPIGHDYASQLGWGTTLKAHWEPDEGINGFEQMNDHPRYRAADSALRSGDYDAVILTEMVELTDAIKYFESDRYFSKWAELAREARPDTRVFLYETWHWLDDPDGWLNRLDRDLVALWENEILLRDMARNPDNPAHVIPVGQVLSRFVRAVEARGGVPGIEGPEALFHTDDQGRLDPIHMGDLGNYLIALTHYAVLYQASPVGLPHQLNRADGSPALAPSPEAARLMQEIVWQTVTSYPKTGVPQ
ncbi:hypothetical protein KBY24_13580 [Ruegeria pomeroyi]|uniref:Uncharacterized protein n=1 Tax=Ruegeria alba TaxID=2916756 RepID=A0ABS9NX77_9RHOB|nr:hypothetical protein [Ruegeria alba]MCE8534417.1 hypothetical protein [Ruegeria pomeroyi]MCG6558504.1 hypothetical protein [Ruegeria alba]